MFDNKMSDKEKSKSLLKLPPVPVKTMLSKQLVFNAFQEAPYRALIGVVLDGRTPPRSQERTSYHKRCQTGLTNRWRLPDSLYSDLLGSSQALKAINLPFKKNLVNTLADTYTTMNPVLLTCKDFADVNEHYWSLMNKSKMSTFAAEESKGHLPPI